MPKWTSIDAYIDALPDDRQRTLRTMRDAVKAGAAGSGAVEVIAYDMPALRLAGRFLVSYASYQRHASLFPATDAVIAQLGAELAPHLHGSGTIRFPADQPLPADLVRRIVAIRVAEHGSDAG